MGPFKGLKSLAFQSVCRLGRYLVVETLLGQLLADVANLGAAKSRPVVKLALEDACLAAQQLQQLAHCHTGGEPVWVHDHVWADTLHTHVHIITELTEAGGI
jgi:hypothetical protein